MQQLQYSSIESLLHSSNRAIVYFTEKDLLGSTKSVEELWDLPAAQKILRRQQPDGYWVYPQGNQNLRSQTNYNQYETYRNLGSLIEKFGFTNKHPAIQKAASYLFSFQSKEGDFRGIYGNQYSPNYSAGITELLIKAGYENDKPIHQALSWLLSIRQNTGGWAIPFRTRGQNLSVLSSEETIALDPTQPASYMVTGVVLRAFAAHSRYSAANTDLKIAGELLMEGFFKRDKYPDRQDPSYWTRFAFPFRYTDLNSSLDSLSLLGFNRRDPRIQSGLRWFSERQKNNGLWDLKLLNTGEKELNLWLALSICRVFKRLNRK